MHAVGLHSLFSGQVSGHIWLTYPVIHLFAIHLRT